MTASLSPTPIFKGWNNDGTPLSYGWLTTYKAGTTIKQAAYVDSTQTTTLTNPQELNFRGETPLWLDPTLTYKFLLTDQFGNTMPGYPVDNIPGGFSSGGFSGNFIPNPTDTYTLGTPTNSWANLYLGPNAVPAFDVTTGNIGYYAITPAETYAMANFGAAGPVEFFYAPGNAFRYGVDPTGVKDSTVTIQNWIDCSWAIYNWVDEQGLWDGAGSAQPVMQLPPGKFKVSGSMYLPNGVTFRGTGHPAHTISHTRIIMNSTGTTPARPWTASTPINFFAQITPSGSPGNLFRATSSGATNGVSWGSAGITGASQPSWNVGTIGSTTTVDGTVTWTYEGPASTVDNRNKPMFLFGRGSYPRSGASQPPPGSTIVNSAVTTTIQELEFWAVTNGNDFSNPLGGDGIAYGDYPDGGVLAFDVDAADFYVVDCVFQNNPAGLWINGVGTTLVTRPDGFQGNRGVGIFFDRCEFDSASSHVYAVNSYLNLFFRNCYFFTSYHIYQNCTGTVSYKNCEFYGCQIDAWSVPNGFESFEIKNCTGAGGGGDGTNVLVSFANSSPTGLINISDLMYQDANGFSTIIVQAANGGRVSNNTIDSSGFNAAASAVPLTTTAAIKLLDCQNVLVDGNNITTSITGGVYLNFGILTASVAATSQNNFVNNNAVPGLYTGATFNGQDRRINLAAADIRGVNFDPNGGVVVPLGGSLNLLGELTVSGAPAVATSGQVSFGASTATSATGGSSGAPPTNVAGYLEINVGGTVYKLPYYNT